MTHMQQYSQHQPDISQAGLGSNQCSPPFFSLVLFQLCSSRTGFHGRENTRTTGQKTLPNGEAPKFCTQKTWIPAIPHIGFWLCAVQDWGFFYHWTIVDALPFTWNWQYLLDMLVIGRSILLCILVPSVAGVVIIVITCIYFLDSFPWTIVLGHCLYWTFLLFLFFNFLLLLFLIVLPMPLFLPPPYPLLLLLLFLCFFSYMYIISFQSCSILEQNRRFFDH